MNENHPDKSRASPGGGVRRTARADLATRCCFSRWLARAVAAAALIATGAGAAGAERVALVVGNADYEHTIPLANPANDARDMAATLRRLGFDVVMATDLDREGLFDQIGVFHERARDAAVSLFFYAGHGLQVDGTNYLVPVDARLEQKLDVRRRAVELGDVMAAMGGGVNLVFLDACRNNPLAAPLARSMGLSRDAAATRGLAPVRRAVETLIAYATDPGEVAADGTGRNSPFTAALLEHLDTPRLSINDLLTRVKRSVREHTSGRQHPWTHDSLSTIFYFQPDGAGSDTLVSGPAPGTPDPAAEMWKQIREAGDAGLVREFLASYPDSAYEGAARALLIRRSRQPFTVTTEPAGAQVRILNIEERYRPGMELPVGDYRVEASLDGHETAVRTVRHASTPTLHRIVLRRSVVRRSAGERFRDCPGCPEMVVIPAGRFEMGCDSEDCDDDEKPVHEVRIWNDFALGRYEVTVGEFRRFVEAAGYRTDAEKDGGRGCRTKEIMDRNEWGWTPGRSWRNLEYALEDRQPVTCVSWNDAKAYVAWLTNETGAGYRLPSEAEWEYAVRVGTRTRYHFGDASERLCAYGNVADRTKLPNGNVWVNTAECEDGAVYPTAVGSYRPNAFGLYDMHGNVWEWVEDCWNGSYAGAPSDGVAWVSGDCAKRVLRGGSWYDDPRNLRAAYRFRLTTGNRFNRNGFRVARTLTP